MDTLPWSDGRADAHRQQVVFYEQLFSANHAAAGLQAHLIPTTDQIDKVVDFFAWSAWTATGNRPGYNYSYTNNWPSPT